MAVIPKVGEKAPVFKSVTAEGNDISLTDYQGKKVVLYFFPKADTPGCTKQACAYRDNYGEFQENDIEVLGISPDTAEDLAEFKAKYELPFTLVADPLHDIAQAYGVWGDITFWNPAEEQQVTMEGVSRTTFIVDEGGYITYNKRDVNPINDPGEVLAQVK